jgi:hypothetical protein
MSVSRRTPSSTEELAVLVDGPWASRWYWRDDLEQMQAASARYPDGHVCAQHRDYVPTDQWREHPHEFPAGRVWRYQPAHSPMNRSPRRTA